MVNKNFKISKTIGNIDSGRRNYTGKITLFMNKTFQKDISQIHMVEMAKELNRSKTMLMNKRWSLIRYLWESSKSISTPISSPSWRTFLVSQKRSNRTSTEEEERPVCKSERKTETLAISHGFSLLVSLKEWRMILKVEKNHIFL